MAQIFHRGSNALAKASIVCLLILVGFLLWIVLAFSRSAFQTDIGVAHAQPVPFTHQHHVAGLGIDCRYCHTSVETDAFAGIPPTQTCMNCHSQIWTNAEMLEPVRASWRNEEPIAWRRINNLQDFVQFNHSIHVQKGIGCDSCHGRVDQMPLTWKAESLSMSFCLDCHRNPEKYVRPRSEVFNLAYRAENQAELGPQLVEEYRIRKVTTCSACHY